MSRFYGFWVRQLQRAAAVGVFACAVGLAAGAGWRLEVACLGASTACFGLSRLGRRLDRAERTRGHKEAGQ